MAANRVLPASVKHFCSPAGRGGSCVRAGAIQDSGARVEEGARSVRTVQDGLEALMESIQKQAEGARGALAAVQHQMKESAVARDRMANALQIKNMVSGEKLEVPAGLLKQYPLLEELVKKIKAGQFDLFDEGPDGPAKSGTG